MFNWNKYLELGKELMSSDDECNKRAGISRIYYGLYNLARRKMSNDLLNDLGKEPGGLHKKMWEEFFSDDSEDDKVALMAANVARSARNYADYDSSSYKLSVFFKNNRQDIRRCFTCVYERLCKKPNLW